MELSKSSEFANVANFALRQYSSMHFLWGPGGGIGIHTRLRGVARKSVRVRLPPWAYMKLVSACLIGIKCRYDGKSNLNKKCLGLFKKGKLIPVCPEQLGGLQTPREKSEIQKNGKILTKSGKDVTKNFIKGARKTLKLVKLLEIKEAMLKSKSPSCGCGKIYDGTFSGRLIKGNGVTAALLKKNKIKVYTEFDEVL